MIETTSTPKPVETPTIVDPAGQPATPAEPTLASRRTEIVDVVTRRAQRVAETTRTRLESARSNAAARVQELRKVGDNLVTSSRDRIPVRVRLAMHDQLERVATALHAAAKRLEPRA